jgi:gliding motility-associated-like protein
MWWKISVFVLFISTSLSGQEKRVFLYNFNSCFLQENNSNAGDVSNLNPAICGCGIEGEALNCSGQVLTWPIAYDSIFKNDWSLGFAVRLGNVSGIIDLFSKQNSCNSDTSFSIVYRSVDSSLNVNIRQGFDKEVSLRSKLKLKSCWQQIFVTKNLGQFRLYEDGELLQELNTSFLIQVNNKQALQFNGSNCSFQNFQKYSGLLDNVIIADHTILSNEILKYYSPQQDIITKDTLIFLGQNLNLVSTSNCPISVQWSPTNSLISPNSLITLAMPTQTTNYIAKFNDNGCVIIDSVLVRVVDKEKLECENLQLPTAFTPNNDGLNESFGISNFYLISSLDYFDIFDRNGGLIASFKESNSTWDGTWKGNKLTPGTYFYKIAYTCKNNDYFKSGSFYLLK